MKIMKLLINFLLVIITVLALNACSSTTDDNFDSDFESALVKWGINYHNVCTSVTDAIKYTGPWNKESVEAFIISDEAVRSMSTCGLLVTLLEYPRFDPPSSNFSHPVVTEFNNDISKDKIAIELFKRSDCFPVLTSKYLTLIKDNYLLKVGRGEYLRNGQINYIEMLLASDLCMSVLDKDEKKQIMTMALALEEKERAYYDECYTAKTYTMMIAIMLWCNYTPFIEEVGSRISEGAVGYFLTEPNGDVSGNCLSYSHVELILKFTKDFLNKNK
jgi:hypothetical protein